MASRQIEIWRERARRIYRRYMRWIIRNVPPGGRWILGVLLIAGGFLGFLPVLGFWMIPLGIAAVLLDLPRLRRWWKGRRRRN